MDEAQHRLVTLRDALLCSCVRLRLRVTSRCSIETTGRIELMLVDMEASFDLSCTQW